MDYIDMEFYRAEAIERGYNVTGTAEQHYDSAMAMSIRYWGGSQTDALTYLARPDVAYTTATGTWQQKIGFQKWIALYCRGFDGWTELRRFDYPAMVVPQGAVSGFPNRLTYPAVNPQPSFRLPSLRRQSLRQRRSQTFLSITMGFPIVTLRRRDGSSG